MIKSITHKSWFWILFFVLSMIAMIFSYKFFPKTFGIVHVDISMDRTQALEKAKSLHTQLGWQPQTFQQSALFDVNNLAKTYIELEAGGVAAFSKIIEEKFYAPYTWSVRQFHEFDIHETTILFTPEGKPYGFDVMIPEDEPGATLNTADARTLAEKTAEQWNFDLTLFKLVEESESTMPGGRVDHTFTYEGLTKVGEAPYRLTIIIKGDRAGHLSMIVKVPEAFERRYGYMRSFNNTLALTATVIMIIFYFFIGTLLGLVFLYRKKALAWKWALVWSFIIALFHIIQQFNELPLAWMEYPTALSKSAFLSHYTVTAFYIFCFYFSIGFMIIAVAEGLTRLAFGNHLQFWKTGSAQGASSLQVLGRTVGAYLMVNLDMAYIMIFYFFAFKYLGWWSPAEALYNPNVLSSYLPWLNPIGKSLSAGFLEECIFRAIPLAGAALIGQRYGKKKLFVIVVYIIQALVFGAAHANYPAQPFFARMAELIIPSFIFGFIYLKFGLLSGVITHFVFDVIWFALPIFVSSSPELLSSKIIIIFLSALPLLRVLIAGIKHGGWHIIGQQLYNKAWQSAPSERIDSPLTARPPRKPPFVIPTSILGFGAAACLAGWLMITEFRVPISPLTLSRSQAIAQAQEALTPELATGKWNILAGIRDPFTSFLEHSNKEEIIFAWRHIADKKDQRTIFHKLTDSYLLPPHWYVRFTKDSENVVERAEEFRARIGKSGEILQVEHILPQDAALLSLSKQEAQQLVKDKVLAHYPEQFELVSALEKKEPNRKDWFFTFNTSTDQLTEGQKRLYATVAGNTINNAYRFIFVPEQWQRSYQQEETIKAILTPIQNFLLLLALLLTLSIFFIRIPRKKEVSIKALLMFGIFFVLRAVAQTANLWYQYTSTFSTKAPFAHQAFALISSIGGQTLFDLFLYAALAGLLYRIPFKSIQAYRTKQSRLFLGLLCGTGIALLYQGLQSMFEIQLSPPWPDLTAAGGIIPGLSECLYHLMHFVRKTLLFSCIVALIDLLAHYQKTKFSWLFIILVTIGLVPITTPFYWIVGSTIFVCFAIIAYHSLIPYAQATVPFALATFMGLQALRQGIFAAYPGALIGGIISCVVLLACGWYWSENLEKNIKS